jgi:hypothetical protein
VSHQTAGTPMRAAIVPRNHHGLGEVLRKSVSSAGRIDNANPIIVRQTTKEAMRLTRSRVARARNQIDLRLTSTQMARSATRQSHFGSQESRFRSISIANSAAKRTKHATSQPAIKRSVCFIWFDVGGALAAHRPIASNLRPGARSRKRNAGGGAVTSRPYALGR